MTTPSASRPLALAAILVTLLASLVGVFGVPNSWLPAHDVPAAPPPLGMAPDAVHPGGWFGGLRGVRQYAWTCDDAFISFRYAEIFARGDGLVYNVDERVEGYTNFLWNVLVAAGMGLGIDPIDFSLWVGGLFHLLTCVLLFVAVRMVAGSTAFRALPFGIAAVGFALHEHAQIYASCGLETAMVDFLVLLLLLLTARARTLPQYLVAGLVGTVTALTRMDAALFYGFAGLATIVWSVRGRDWRPFVGMAAAGALIYVPYFVWRWSYYGWPFPNIFYLRSVAEGYPEQGMFYAWTFFKTYWILIPALFVPVVLLPFRDAEGRRFAARREVWLIAIFSWLYTAYVARVGGGFMYARYLLPVTPLLYLSFELLRAKWRSTGFALVLGAVVVSGTLLRDYPEEITQPGGARRIFEERNNYPRSTVELYRTVGLHLRELLDGTKPRVAIFGMQAMLGYYADFHLTIECAAGLTDEYLAHMEIEERGAIGHEKGVARDPEYLLRRHVHFYVPTDPTAPVGERNRMVLGTVTLELADGSRVDVPVPAVLHTWDRDFMDAIRGRPGVSFFEFEEHLDDVITRLDAMPVDMVKAVLADFDAFYFRHNDDAARRGKFVARIEQG
jgi:hypothetical protein